MLNYHDTKKGSLFWISKIKWYVIQHQRQRTKQLFYSNHLLYNQQSYSYLNIEKHPFCVTRNLNLLTLLI